MQRQYQAPEFRVRDTREFQHVQVAAADTRVAPPLVVGDDSWRDKMLEQLGGNAANMLNKMADIEFSNLYLEGQAKAGVIESEEELQGNPLTRDWQVAGYRDTMGKLALADTEAQFAVDIVKLREKGPEEIQAYLATRREKLMPALGSMSREARAAAAGQLLLQDRAATKTWTTEHAKFIIEQKSQAVHTQWNTSLRTLGNAQIKKQLGELQDKDYNEQLRSTVGTMVQSVWMDASLPQGVKQQLTFEMLQNALANDSVDLYDFVASNEIPDGAGGASTLMSRLTGEQQGKVANSYREAQSRTRDARNMAVAAQVANLEAQIDNDAYTGTYEDLTSMLDPMLVSKGITGERRQGIINKFLDKQYKGEQNSALAELYLRGDLNGIFSAGKEQADGLKALDAMLTRRGASPEQRLNAYLQSGLNGMDGGFKKAGEVLGTALRQVRSPDGTVLPQHLATVRTINNAVRQAEERGQTGIRVALLSGLAEGDRMFAERVFAQVDGGASYDEAVLKATDTEAKEAQLTPAVRAAQTQQVANAVAAEIAALESRGVLSSAWTWAKSIFSSDAASDMQLRPWSSVRDRDGGWFSDGPTVQFYTQRVREELANEANHVLLQSPGASADQVISVAKANVAARTISTRFGPLTMPRNVKLEDAFGVGKGNQAAIGPALDAMLKETKEDANWQLAFVNGRLFAQEVDRTGQRVGTGTYLNPKDIGTKIKQMTDAEQEKANNVFGSGRRVQQDGVTVQFNGLNTAGVPATWMMGFRDNLVNHEGIRAKPYQDLSGAKDTKGNPIMTVGVGVSSHNPRYPKVQPDGTVKVEDIRRSFVEASNDAAIAGSKVARDLGRHDQPTFMLMSELAYQSGTAFMSQQNKTGERYREFANALKTGNVEAAQEAFKRTAAWYYSADPKNRDKITPRQQNYLRLIQQALKG
ncbi:internal virion protein [Sphaerotilus phage vB_SnaP-R1]|uniref:Internal virion protein n=1 Tax=Sphaerotilus phage vB_SnaP-R1 TaxID=2696336 RepID=A0A6B9SUK1_9CAUD|nr:internal virion protein [Sphaerotilus phage vB_SnaP-R1]